MPPKVTDFSSRDKAAARVSIPECRKLNGIPKGDPLPFHMYVDYAKSKGVSQIVLLEYLCVRNGLGRDKYRKYLYYSKPDSNKFIYNNKGIEIIITAGDII